MKLIKPTKNLILVYRNSSTSFNLFISMHYSLAKSICYTSKRSSMDTVAPFKVKLERKTADYLNEKSIISTFFSFIITFAKHRNYFSLILCRLATGYQTGEQQTTLIHIALFVIMCF